MHMFSAPRPVVIGQAGLAGEFALPEQAQRLALIVHPDGNSLAHAGRRFVADVLRANGVATLSVGLLTPAEAARGAGLPAPEIIASRLRAMLAWLARHVDTPRLQVGLVAFDAAVPACLAASHQRGLGAVRALVMVDGAPLLALTAVRSWRWPGLAIVGRNESLPKPRGRRPARAGLPAPHRVVRLAEQTLPSAAPGAFEAMACEATAWLRSCVPPMQLSVPPRPRAAGPASRSPSPSPSLRAAAVRRGGDAAGQRVPALPPH